MDLIESRIPTLASLLPQELMASLEATGKLKHFADGELVQLRGDQRESLSLVKRGHVQAGNVGRDGSLVVTSSLGPGQCFGEVTLFAGLPRTHEMMAIGETCICQLNGSRFMQLYEAEPLVGKALLKISLTRNQVLLEFLDGLRREPLPVSVTRLLLANARRDDRSAVIACRQDELAQTFGVSRVSIGKVLKRLKAEGQLELGYGKIRIPDVARLQHWLDARLLVSPLKQNPC